VEPPGCCVDGVDDPPGPVGVLSPLPEGGAEARPTVLPGARGPIQRIEGITGTVDCDDGDAPPDGLGDAVGDPAGVVPCVAVDDPAGVGVVLVGEGLEAVVAGADVVGDVELCQPPGGDPELPTGGRAGWDDVGEDDDVSAVVSALLRVRGGGGTDAGIPGMLGAAAVVVDGDVLGVAAVVDGAGVLRQPCLLLLVCTNRCRCGADTASLCNDPSGAESTQCRLFSLAPAP
jgi:hypothetical protein